MYYLKANQRGLYGGKKVTSDTHTKLEWAFQAAVLVMGVGWQEKEITDTLAFLRRKAYLKSKRTSTGRQKNNPSKKQMAKRIYRGLQSSKGDP